jgi:hypothetical protein
MSDWDNPRTSAIVPGIFATGIAVSALLIASHNRPFTGEISVGPGPLLRLLSERKGWCQIVPVIR